MRKSLISLLLASVIIPAAAHAQDSQERGSRGRAERSTDDNDGLSRPERAERASRAERSQAENRGADRSVQRATDVTPQVGNERIDRQERAQRPDRTPRADRQDRGERPVPAQQQANDTPVVQPQAPGAAQPSRRAQGGSDSLLDGFRRQVGDQNSRPDDRDHDGHDRDKDHDWSKDWRKNDRYDWWNYRNRYRSLYRLGRYNDPYGWGYRRWSIGYSLWPSHYGSNFWLNDPWMYRLPPAYGPYRWVRYYDDAVMVNIYTGNVVDVVYNFFW